MEATGERSGLRRKEMGVGIRRGESEMQDEICKMRRDRNTKKGKWRGTERKGQGDYITCETPPRNSI